MTSVIGTPYARAPRNVRTKNPQVMLKNKDNIQGSSGIFQNIADVVLFMENFNELVQSNSTEKDLRSAVLTLCVNLKHFGAQLEMNYKDQLDRVFIHLRNAGRDDSLDKISRLYLLEVVELRASRWAAQEQVSNYYQSKLNELATGITEISSNAGQTTGQNELSPPVSPLPLLLPGEVVKSSGKYTVNNVGSVSPAKHAIKDEVVIRNADSGKVMGIKGRRVHLIEEISDTVISFQRVNPGASERLVQITGAAPDNIEKARQLIEQTIQRNASPVPQDPIASPQSNSNNQDCATIRDSLKQSLMDTALEDYQHSVVVGEHCIKITGQSLDLVQTAKLVLDEYFAGLANKRQRNFSACSSMDDGVFFPSQDSPRECAPSVKKILKYDREKLLLWSKSPLCRQPPANFELVFQNAPDIARKDMGSDAFFNATAYLEKYPEQLIPASEETGRHYDAADDV
ncbi:eukaryotic translation initiation factor 4E-binding protein Mextli-like isoform X2 [Daphnia carinata]|uniref:eukaryotic translation initiation factor 4E-binding protein Mextli-like isoform X2 n=1 Tax=Daphnia carinata TaxID=120202 RepID=UPI00257DAA74|nr:eukaryotic translation initiation factor 4E-binding protein Mextli-like isoform X2 [Daphnia carinata]